MELKLQEIIESLDNSSGQLFFDRIVLSLASAIDVDYVFVASLDKVRHISKTISLAAKGNIADNFEYALKDTPCNDVSKNTVCCFTSNITELYPNDQLLKDMNIEAYIGSPLRSSRGDVIGLLVALSEKAVKNPERVKTLFKVFSGRIAVEMERTALEQKNQVYLKRLETLNNSLEKKVASQVHDIEESNLLFETVFNTTKDSISILDSKLNYMLVNSSYEEMTGYFKEELYEKSLSDFILPDKLEVLKEILHEVLEKGFYKNYESTCVFNDLKEVDVRMDIVLMPDKERYLFVARDITEENILKKEKLLQEAHLLQQSRLAQMGEMISMIAHQWRQPLGAISSVTIDLQMKQELDTFDSSTKDGQKKFRDYLSKSLTTMEELVKRLTTTIDDFRSFYRSDKEFKFTTFEHIVTKALSIIEGSLINTNTEVIYNYNSKEEINMCTTEMMHVVLNILKNSQDNFREKKLKNPSITISTTGTSISICDNGGGIPDDVIDKIFDPYFSTKDEKNGTGLGLYMSKTIVEEHHNGELLVENKDGGVCFTIKL